MTPAETLLAIAARFAELPDLPPGSPDAYTQRQAPVLLSRLATKIASPDPAVSAVGREQLAAIAASWRDRKTPGWSLWAGALAAIGELVPEPVAAPVEQGAGQTSIALLLAAAYERGRAKGREEAGAKVTDLEAQLSAAPAGHRVAALLAAVEVEHKEALKSGSVADENEEPHDSAHADGRLFALSTVRDLIRQHLGEPTPEERAAVEVLALLPSVTNNGAPWSPSMHWTGIAETAASISDDCNPSRAEFAHLAAEAIAGILACDAAGLPTAGSSIALRLAEEGLRGSDFPAQAGALPSDRKGGA